MRVIFVNPPSPFLLDDRGAPPLGLLQLAAAVRASGRQCLFWDMTGSTALAHQFGCNTVQFVAKGDVDLPLAAWNGLSGQRDVIAITATSAQYQAALNICLAVKWNCPDAKVIIGGPHASALPEEVLADGFDTVCVGEADHFLPAWLNEGCLPGIFRARAPQDLTLLPLPARDLVKLSSYCANLTVGQGFSSTIMCSRGCPYQCAYCVRTLGDAARKLRMRSVLSVLDECQELDLTYGLRRFVAVDDIFGIPRPWMQEFCHVFADEPYHFRINCRANCLHYDLLPRMKRAGIDCISFGFESGSEQVLNAISKNTVDLNTKAVHACHDAGIAVKAYLIFGFAEDNRESLEATMRWVEEAKPDTCQASWLVPLPSTPIYQRAIDQGWQADYSTLYHLGIAHRGGMARLPWHTDETAGLYEELCQWLEAYYQQPRPAIECPNALSEAS